MENARIAKAGLPQFTAGTSSILGPREVTTGWLPIGRICYLPVLSATRHIPMRFLPVGKLDQFPLLTEAYRLTIHQGTMFFSDKNTYTEAFNREEAQRLLIRPCTDVNIEGFFKYDDHGVILVGDALEPTARRKAETSIQVYALQRLGLVHAREAKVIQVRAQIRRVEKAIDDLNKYFDSSEEERTWFEGYLRKEMQILQRFKDPDQEYSGLARHIIRKYFQDFNTR